MTTAPSPSALANLTAILPRSPQSLCRTGVDDAQASGADFTVVVGVLFGICGALLSSFGLVFQKYGHITGSRDSIIGGFATYVSGVLVSTLALSFAPQSIVAALTSLSLVGNAVFAPWLLKEKLQHADIAGVAICCVGTGLVVAFGEKCVPTYSVHDLVNFFLAPGQLVLFFILFGTIGLGVMYIAKADAPGSNEREIEQGQERRTAKGSTPSRGIVVPAKVSRVVNTVTNRGNEVVRDDSTSIDIGTKAGQESLPKMHKRKGGRGFCIPCQKVSAVRVSAAITAFNAAALAAYSTILSKVTTELIKTTAKGNQQFDKPGTWLFILALTVFVCCHVWWLNRGLKRFEALLWVPLFQVFLTMMSILSGGVFFQEWVLFSLEQGIGFPGGVLVTLCGVGVLSKRNATSPGSGVAMVAANTTVAPESPEKVEDAKTSPSTIPEALDRKESQEVCNASVKHTSSLSPVAKGLEKPSKLKLHTENPTPLAAVRLPPLLSPSSSSCGSVVGEFSPELSSAHFDTNEDEGKSSPSEGLGMDVGLDHSPTRVLEDRFKEMAGSPLHSEEEDIPYERGSGQSKETVERDGSPQFKSDTNLGVPGDRLSPLSSDVPSIIIVKHNPTNSSNFVQESAVDDENLHEWQSPRRPSRHGYK